MNKLLSVVSFACLVFTTTIQAQSDPGREQVTNFLSSADATGAQPFFIQTFTPVPQTASAVAEAITPDIQALAGRLGYDPTQIYNYVHDQIKYVHYFGSLKGAQLTLLERSGNDFDQCALLSALLQAAGYSPTYQFGYQIIPFESANHQDLHHLFALNLTDNSWTNKLNFIGWFFGSRGYGAPYFTFGAGDTNDIAFQRVLVNLTIGGTNYLLDPSFKVSEPIIGTNLATAMQLSVSNLTNAAGGTDTGYSVTGLNESALRTSLQACNSNLLAFFSNNAPNASVAQIIGGQQIVSSSGLPLPTSSPFTNFINSSYPFLTWTNQPTNFMSTFSITFGGTNQTWYTPQLQGQRISLTFDTNGLGQVWQDDSLILQTTNTGTSNTLNVILSATHPYGSWNTTTESPVDTGIFDKSSTNAYQRTNASYAIMYAFEASPQWLQERQQKLDAYQQLGLASTSRQVTTETLNVMGLGWMVQTELAQELLSQEWGQAPHHHHRFGRMGQELSRGYYVDVYLQQDATFPTTGYNAPDQLANNEEFDVSSYMWSAMEHAIIEQLQNSNLVAASTVKMLEIASTNAQAVYMGFSSVWTSGPNVRGSLVNYSASTLSTLDGLISQGFVLLLPQNGSNQVTTGTGMWAGDGYVQLGTAGGGRSMGMIIGGGYHGGYDSNPTATVNPPFVSQSGDVQPTFINPVSPSTPAAVAADPVNMADGTFQLSAIPDLSIGHTEPRGITLARYYSTELRNHNFAGMANGWLHNYYFNLVPVSAPEPALGTTTPQQMSAMIVATYAMLKLYNNTSPDPRNWMTTALIAKWGNDQIINNAVSISMGKDTVQFLRQPDGSYTPPAGSTMTLVKTGSVYNLLERHGNTFKFGTNNLLTNIVDQYGQGLNLTYNTSNWVSTITDWKSRTLTFTYSNTPSRLVSIGDSTGRTVAYGYATNANGQLDLTSVTDAEGKTSTFAYDTNHDIVATFDALSHLVVSNIFDNSGHVTSQYTQGDTNKLWQIFASGNQTAVIDPAGAQQLYIYDAQSRQIGFQDALGNLSRTYYDGQDHVVMAVSPLNETNQFIYDGNHNLLASIDPLGYSNQYFYDTNFNLIRKIDARGHTNTFGYNTKFQLLVSTNAMGDSVTNTYDPTIGVLLTRSDSGGTTTYGYDTFGQLSSVVFPGNTGTNLYFNSTNGDVLTFTNAQKFVTTYQYNLRRQITNTVAPTNLTASIAYDAVGNVFSTKDARGLTTLNTWSPTRHLLATTLPSTLQGTPVITNVYDSRDLLIKTFDPLQHSITNNFDLNGRVLTVTDPMLRTTSITYDNDGRKITTTNAALEGIAQQFNIRGEMINTVDQIGKSVFRGYDPAGNLVALTNRNGKAWQFLFDAANRLTNTTSPLLNKSSQVWNSRGLLQSTLDPKNQPATFAYDARGRLTNRADNVATTTYQYDFNGNRTNVIELGKTNSWTFDAYDRPITYKDSASNVIKYAYDANGNLTNLTYPGKGTVVYSYDTLNRLTNVTDWANRQTTYTYDLASRVTSITRPNGTVRSNLYDSAGELTNILEQAASHAPIAFLKLNWNSAARVQYEFGAPFPSTNAQPSRTMTYDDDNRLATFNGSSIVNDNNGNMTSGPVTNGTFSSYSFDARNRLLNVAGTGYTYDPANNRVALTNSTTSNIFVVDAKSSQVMIRIKSGITNYYVYGVGLLYEEDDTATTTSTLTYHYDSRGSTVALTDGNGNVTDRIQYSAYGMVMSRNGTNDTPFQYNGRYGVQTDPDGLLYMRNRYYNSYICRFINADPSGFAGGLNFYAYANGNPISMIDPFGLGAVGEGGSSYWHDVGQVFLGEGDAVVGLVSGIGNAVLHPVNTVNGIGNVIDNAIDNPGQALQGIGNSIGNTFNALTGPDPRAAGQAAGNIIIAGASIAVPFAEAGAVADGANALRFSQTTASPWFSEGSLFEGSTISDVAGQLRAGTLTAADVPIQTVTLDGNTLIVNTRSSLALSQAGIPQTSWNLIDMTGNADTVSSITTRLGNNGLTTAGTDTLRITGSGSGASTLVGSGTIARPY